MSGNPLSDIKFKNDFGNSPLGLGLLLKDSGLVGLATVILTVLSLPVGGTMGIPLALAVAAIGANDCKALSKEGQNTQRLPGQPDRQRLKPAAPIAATTASAQPAAAAIITPPPAATAPAPAPAPAPASEDIDLPQLLAAANSSIVMGAPRAGKGFAAAQALRLVPEHFTPWLLDPKNDPRERHYWSRIHPERRLQFNNLSSQRPSDKDVLAFVARFFDSAVENGNHLLIIDEIPALSNMMGTAAFKKMMGQAASAASTGPSMGIKVWLLTQDSTCEQMGFSAQSRACLAQFAVTSDLTPKSWLAGFCQSTKAPMPTGEGFQAYDGKRWANSKPYPPLPKGEFNGIRSSQPSNSTSNSSESSSNWVEFAPEFDPTNPESETEFARFRELVCGGLAKDGNEILDRLWGVKPGSSSRYKAARSRRDHFVARLADY